MTTVKNINATPLGSKGIAMIYIGLIEEFFDEPMLLELRERSTYGANLKTIQQMYWADIYIAPFGDLAWAYQIEVIVHEFGHAMGFSGHSPNSSDVMYPYNHSNYSITANDIIHLKQFYDYYGV